MEENEFAENGLKVELSMESQIGGRSPYICLKRRSAGGGGEGARDAFKTNTHTSESGGNYYYYYDHDYDYLCGNTWALKCNKLGHMIVNISQHLGVYRAS